MSVKDPSLEIEVDNREPKSDINYEGTFELMQKIYPNTKKTHLDIFDILYKNVGFELKTWEDLIIAIEDTKDNRFKTQVFNIYTTMKNNPELDAYYVIYGDWKDINAFSQIKMTAILGAMASLEARTGIRVKVFPNKKYAIYSICKIIEKTFHKKDITPTTYRILTEDRAKNMIYSSAERISTKAVNNLMEKHGTVKNISNLTIKELSQCDGIGKIIAERIFETINYDFRPKREFEEVIEKDIEEDSQAEDIFKVDFDMEKDKIKDYTKVEEIRTPVVNSKHKNKKKVEEKLFENVPTMEDMDKDIEKFEERKKGVFFAIKKFSEVKRKPCPLQWLIEHAKFSETIMRQVLLDLEMESKIYQALTDQYEVY